MTAVNECAPPPLAQPEFDANVLGRAASFLLEREEDARAGRGPRFEVGDKFWTDRDAGSTAVMERAATIARDEADRLRYDAAQALARAIDCQRAALHADELANDRETAWLALVDAQKPVDPEPADCRGCEVIGTTTVTVVDAIHLADLAARLAGDASATPGCCGPQEGCSDDDCTGTPTVTDDEPPADEDAAPFGSSISLYLAPGSNLELALADAVANFGRSGGTR